MTHNLALVASELATNAIRHGRPPGEGGFGLQIARRLCVDVGWYRTAVVKVVWAEVGR